MQAHARPPGYFIRLENTSAEDNLYLSKRVRMRRWLCCTCQVDESYPSNENEHLKSAANHVDSGMLPQLSLMLVQFAPWKRENKTFLLIWL